ncbi:MAG: hypothetical protein U9Q77_02975 [Candidatus Marinimicrobia bacterium]|nr:hypothetical protein [Candidatus Neomarinimicrobiota bacterium]
MLVKSGVKHLMLMSFLLQVSLMVGCSSQEQVKPVEQVNGPLAGFTSESRYLVYYGDWSPEQVQYSKKFDLVILHPKSNVTAEVVTEIQNGVDGITNNEDDCLVVGYVSIGEENPGPLLKGNGRGPVSWVDSALVYGETGVASYYLDGDNDGEVDYNGTWGSRYTNAGDPEWYNEILNHTDGLKTVVDTLGCDGFFMDTIDSASPWHTFAWMIPGMHKIIVQIRSDFPSSVLIANRGLFYFYDTLPEVYRYNIRELVNAVMFESYYTSWNWETSEGEVNPWFAENHKAEAVPHVNREAAKPDGFTVLCLDYLNPEQSDYEQMHKAQADEVALQAHWLNSVTDVLLRSGKDLSREIP